MGAPRRLPNWRGSLPLPQEPHTPFSTLLFRRRSNVLCIANPSVCLLSVICDVVVPCDKMYIFVDTSCQQIYKISRKNTTAVNIFQYILKGYFLLKHPVRLMYLSSQLLLSEHNTFLMLYCIIDVGDFGTFWRDGYLFV